MTETDWQLYAKWALGEISDADYADHLEATIEEGDPAAEILIRHLRKPRQEALDSTGDLVQ